MSRKFKKFEELDENLLQLLTRNRTVYRRDPETGEKIKVQQQRDPNNLDKYVDVKTKNTGDFGYRRSRTGEPGDSTMGDFRKRTGPNDGPNPLNNKKPTPTPAPTPTPTPAPTAPAKTFKVGDQQMSKAQINARYDELRKSDPAKAKEFGKTAFAAVNPKLAAADAERARTRGTSATTNPLMKDMKSRLPAPKPAANAAKPAAKPAANVGAPGSQPKGEDLLTGPKPAAKPAANASTPATGAARPAPTPARPAANVGAPGSQPKGEDLLTGPKPAARPAAATGAVRPAPTPARPAVTGAGNRTADLARARRQAMLNTVSKSPNAQRIAARNPMVQRAIAAERGAVNQSIRNSVARANTPANLNRPAPAGTALAKQQARQPVVNRQTGGAQSVGAVGARPAAAKPTSGRGSGAGPAPAGKPKPNATLWESKMTKKTFSQFMAEAHNLNEALPLAIPLAMKLGSLALGAYSAYQAGRKLKKGDYKGAALDAVGALPVGRAFGAAARGLGAGKKLQGLARFAGGTGKEFVPNERTKLIDKAIDKGVDFVSGTPGQGSSAQASKPAATPKPTTKPQQTSAQREAQARSTTTTTTQTKPTTTTTTQTKPTSNTKDPEKKKPPTRMQSMQSASRWV